MLLSIRIQNQRPVPSCRYAAFLQAIPGHMRAKEFPFVFQLVISFSVFFCQSIFIYLLFLQKLLYSQNETFSQGRSFITMEIEY